ncbi:hypothetical protein ABZT08_05660 [Streptomyces sp. NPDC005526]|uniref:hypothetical protein n=1 Tax=Streptomyces sp. NPDC005526 TaxID=3156885 RepID=UPI0033A770B3
MRNALRRDYGSLGWLVPRALARCPPPAQIYYDQVAQIDLVGWSHGRVVLVGDACHAVSLLAGQGASPAMGGAYVPADQRFRASRIEDALHAYERLWRPVIENRQCVDRRAARWFVPESSRQVRARRAALRLAGLPGVQRLVAALAGRRQPALGQFAVLPAWGSAKPGTGPVRSSASVRRS